VAEGNDRRTARRVNVIGAGPAGLMAAERLARAGLSVRVFERMPSPARKFLMAGRGGLNLTHSEPIDRFMTRYGPAQAGLEAAIAAFPPEALRDWARVLGEETFVGSSGRVFPKSFKASPLLRAWLKRLDELGVGLIVRHEWKGWSDDGALLFEGPQGSIAGTAGSATILALGGASWPRLGSDGGWVVPLRRAGIEIAPLRAANCGIRIDWSAHFAERHAGTALKRVVLEIDGTRSAGEAMITNGGLEGGAVYALSRPIRASLDAGGRATLRVDLRPDLDRDDLATRLSRPRGGQSVSTFLRKSAGLAPAAVALLREAGPLPPNPNDLASRIKSLPLNVHGMQGLERAISSSGGILLDEVDGNFMLRRQPGVFVAGEMLDWEAPTGGYLLQASMGTGVAAAEGVIRWLAEDQPRPEES
jgi:uncharacterized flavoprotein (TIGR03862 family)